MGEKPFRNCLGLRLLVLWTSSTWWIFKCLLGRFWAKRSSRSFRWLLDGGFKYFLKKFTHIWRRLPNWLIFVFFIFVFTICYSPFSEGGGEADAAAKGVNNWRTYFFKQVETTNSRLYSLQQLALRQAASSIWPLAPPSFVSLVSMALFRTNAPITTRIRYGQQVALLHKFILAHLIGNRLINSSFEWVDSGILDVTH